MNEIQVEFLGEKYTFPDEVKKYVFYWENNFKKIKEKFSETIEKRINSRWYEYPDLEFEELLKNAGKKVIKDLSEDGIYDVTINELVEQNNGYIAFQNITSKGFERWKNISIGALQEYMDGFENAKLIANSKITGSGMTLYSSSVLAHATFAALELNTIKKQTEKAEKEYRSELSRLEIQNQTKQSKEEDEFLYYELYPAYSEIAEIFVSELMEKYLNILCKHLIFDYTKVKKYNIQKSMDLLENLEVVEDKVRVLKESFVNCPFNVVVYQMAIDIGLLDLNMYKTALIFYKDKEVIEYIKQYCHEHSNDFDDIIDRYISLIALHESKDDKTILKQIYSDKIDHIICTYDDIKNVLDHTKHFERWFINNIAKDVDWAIVDEKEISDKIQDIINQINKKELEYFLLKNVISYEEIRLNNSNSETIEDINLEYHEISLKRIQEHVRKLRIEKERREELRRAEQRKEEEKEKEKRVEKKEKKKKAIKFFLISLCLVIVTMVLVLGIDRISNKYVLSDEDKIERGAKYLGVSIDSNCMEVSQEDNELFENMKLFGYKGDLSHGYTERQNEVIDYMMWRTITECDEDDLRKVIKKLNSLYGDETKKNEAYGTINKAYFWSDVDEFGWIICGINSSEEIEVYWIK